MEGGVCNRDNDLSGCNTNNDPSICTGDKDYNIYFCGSIRGGRQDAPLYNRIVCELQKIGNVLTYHVGLLEVFASEKHMTHAEIYQRDKDWMDNSQVVIAECSQASHGVGFEIAYCMNLGLPILCLFKEDCRASAMVAGCPDVQCLFYSSEDEAIEKAIEFAKNHH
ncbi:hypothetical protein PCE1_003172 [Barthelona sp. PCE]